MNDDQLYSGETQVFWTCKALLDMRAFSHPNKIRDVNGWRLGANIHRLIHDYDWPICADHRGSHNVAHYSLKVGMDRSALRFPPSAQSLAKQEDAQ